MGAQLIEKALAEWRDGERLLRDLPRVDPDHETVRLVVIQLRETYRRLSELSADSREHLDECERQINVAHATIEKVRTRYGYEPDMATFLPEPSTD